MLFLHFGSSGANLDNIMHLCYIIILPARSRLDDLVYLMCRTGLPDADILVSTLDTLVNAKKSIALLRRCI